MTVTQAWCERMATLEVGDATTGTPVVVFPHPVIFLDFDGVLNCQETFRVVNGHHPKRPDELIEPVMVARLERLVRDTDAVIVISSSWRYAYDLNALKSILQQFGHASAFLVDRVVDETPKGVRGQRFSDSPPRGDEILQWLRDHPFVESFVILDDDRDMNRLQSFLVKTSFEEGLQDEHVVAAKRCMAYKNDGSRWWEYRMKHEEREEDW